MISRMNKDGISVISSGEDDEEISYCPQCSTNRHKLHRLGPLIILDPSKPLPPDYDNFKQCGICYTVVPIYDIRSEGKLFTDIEAVRNPFDFGVNNTTGVHKKGLKNRMKDIAKKQKKDDYSKDKDVQKEVKDGAVITGYYTDTT